MTERQLLRVATASLTISLSGPTSSRLGEVSDVEAQAPTLTVDTEGEPVEVTIGTSAEVLTWDPGEPGPRLFEDTPYRLRVKSNDGSVPGLYGPDPTLFGQIEPYPEDSTLFGAINFRRQVGIAEFRVVAGAHRITLRVSVYPTKIDYATDYEACIVALTNVARGLALEFMRATSRDVKAVEAKGPSDLEWVTLLRQRIVSLEQAMRYVNEHPHRVLVRTPDSVRAERIRRISPELTRSVARGRGSGPMIPLPGAANVRERLPTIVPKETLDTAEHRFLRLQLTSVRTRVAAIVAEHTTYLQTLRKQERDTKRAQAELQSLIDLESRVNAMVGFPVLAESTAPPPQGFASLTMLHRAGYGQAYTALLELRMALGLEQGDVRASFSDVNALYEAWCYIELVNSLSTVLGVVPDPAELFTVDSSGIRVRLRQGQLSTVPFELGDGRKGSVTYNKRFDGSTGEQRPDLIITVEPVSGPAVILVLDAKYRLDASAPYLKTFRVPGPPIDAVNALHRYRDAITVRASDRQLLRPVVRCAALFPLGQERSVTFRGSSPLWRANRELGIGAIPLLPSNVDHLREWLTDVLSLPMPCLARPGPRFSGEVHWI